MSPRFAHAVFCDDIRNEIGNKVSLMGLYAADIVFPVPGPVYFPKLHVAFWLVTDIADIPSKVVVRLTGPQENTLLEEHLPPVFDRGNAPDGATQRKIAGFLAFEPGNLTDGNIDCWIDTEEGSIRAGRVAVRFAPANAAPT